MALKNVNTSGCIFNRSILCLLTGGIKVNERALSRTDRNSFSSTSHLKKSFQFYNCLQVRSVHVLEAQWPDYRYLDADWWFILNVFKGNNAPFDNRADLWLIHVSAHEFVKPENIACVLKYNSIDDIDDNTSNNNNAKCPTFDGKILNDLFQNQSMIEMLTCVVMTNSFGDC